MITFRRDTKCNNRLVFLKTKLY